MIFLAIPDSIDPALFQVLYTIATKAVDGTRTPLFVDETNMRVLVKEVAAQAANPGTLEVNGDIRVVGTSNGILMPDAAGTTGLCRLRTIKDVQTGNWVVVLDPVS